MGLPCGPVTKTAFLMQRGPGSIPGQGTRSHMPQLKIPCAAVKTQHRQINKELKNKILFSCSILGKKKIKNTVTVTGLCYSPWD